MPKTTTEETPPTKVSEQCQRCDHKGQTASECYFHSRTFKREHPIMYARFWGDQPPWCD